MQTEGNVDPDALKLDTEMEKVFGGSTTQLRDKFDVNQFGDASEEDCKLYRMFLNVYKIFTKI